MYSEVEFIGDAEKIPKEKQSQLSFPQDAKLISNVNQTDGEEACQYYIHRAHKLYHTKEYATASISYEKCLHLFPASDIAKRQECMEYLSRSLLHMGSLDKALEWALKMDAEATTSKQKVNSLSLLASVCHALGKYEEELEALHSCLDVHRDNPHLWFRIANCYGGLFKIPFPSSRHRPYVVPSCCAFKSRLTIASVAKPVCHEVSIDEGVECCLPAEEICVHNESAESSATCTPDCSVNSRKSKSSSRPNSPILDIRNTSCDSVQQIEKCDVCTVSVQMISTCLLCSRLYLSNCEESPLGQDKHHQMDEKITDCLNHMEVEQTFIDEASQMLLINQRDTVAYLTSDLSF